MVTQAKQQFLIAKVQGVIDRAHEYDSGTYNRQDPTHYSKSSIDFNGFHIEINDVTWGVEITIYSRVLGRNGKKKLAGLYFTDEGRQRNVLIFRENWSHKWFGLFDKINAELPLVDRNYMHDVYSEMELSYSSII